MGKTVTGKRVRIKMCGMTRQEDIHLASQLGVDAIGLVFYEGSKRFVSPDKAKALLAQTPLFVDTVAVLVNPTPDFVHHLINTLPLQWLQFHGVESPSFCRQFHLPYIKAIPANGLQDYQKAMADYADAAGILVDSQGPGGSGKTFDWKWIPKARSKPLLLAGGLNLENISAAIKICSPCAVDLCSGIEATSGIKDHEKMRAFVKACGES